MSEILTGEHIKTEAWKWGRDQPSIHLPDLVVGFENGSRFALAAAAEREKVWQEFAAELRE